MTATTDNNNDVQIGPCGNGVDGKNRTTAETFANVFKRAYLDASDEVRCVIDEMSRICSDLNVEKDDYDSALDTLTDALFPQMHKGELGIDLGDVKVLKLDGPEPSTFEQAMAEQEATFATRLASLLETQNISQQELAAKIGVGQPAISMMLARDCRPQRRTIQKLADAFGIQPDQLWPGYSE